MTQTAINYGKVLYQLNVPKESILETQRLLKEVPELLKTLENPTISFVQKQRVINRVFPKELHNFLCVVCKYKHAELLNEIFQAYQEHYNEQKKILSASLYYVTPPKAEQLEGIKKFLKKQYHTQAVALELKEDKSLVGGFIIRTKDHEYDNSLKGSIHELQQKLIWR